MFNNNPPIPYRVNQIGVKDRKRQYIVVTTTYAEAKKCFSSEKYNIDTGSGEQRDLVQVHVRALRKELEEGNFTPTSISVGLRDSQRSALTFQDGNSKVGLLLRQGDTLPLLDGGHRMAALGLLAQDEKYKDDVEKSSVTALVILDGDTKKDFLNLQRGRAVDKSHLHSLSVQANLIDKKNDDVIRLSYEIAKALNTNVKSPFYRQIRFDSSGISGVPIASLSAKGASDIATSLVGTAKIAKWAGKDVAWANNCISKVYEELLAQAPELLNSGMKLCPPPSGTKGSATILIGVGNILAYRLAELKRDEATPEDLSKLIEICRRHFSNPVDGNFSGPTKRSGMGAFVADYLADLNVDKHENVPVKLVNLFSISTFNLSKLPEEKKEKPPKPVKVKAEKPKKVSKKKKEENDEIVSFDGPDAMVVDKVDSVVEDISWDGPTEDISDISEGKAPWEFEDC